ncbi:MAG: hypothetical protein U9R21_01800 [Candidatus Thermoplasmatota archaeon]|nr:hypothetical protein [Candidatus Thermoplasmatota archaeon]
MKKLRKCPNCGRKLPESKFYKDKTREDGISINCKKCVDEYFKQYQKQQTDAKIDLKDKR